MSRSGSPSQEQIHRKSFSTRPDRLQTRRVAMAVVGSVLSAVALAGVNTWTTTWPPGGARGVIVDPASGAVYGGSAYLLKSVDNGTTWITVCPSVPSAIPLAARDEVLYATDGPTLYRSLDGGGHCDAVASDPGYNVDLLIDPFDSNTLYRNEVQTAPRIGTPYVFSVLTRSVDRGVNWTDMCVGCGLVSALAADAAHRGTLYKGTLGVLPGRDPKRS